MNKLVFALGCFALFFSPNIVIAQEIPEFEIEEESIDFPFEDFENSISSIPGFSEEETSKPKKTFGYQEGDGFLLRFHKNSFLRLDARTQFLREQDVADLQDVSNELGQLRPTFRGQITKRFLFKFTADFADLINEKIGIADNGLPKLAKDAFVSTKVGKSSLFVIAGHFKSSFGRQNLHSSGALLLLERSDVDDEFTFGRGVGAMIAGQSPKKRFQYTAGINADVQTAVIDELPAVPLLTARVVLNPNSTLRDDEGPLTPEKSIRTSFGFNIALPLEVGNAFGVNLEGAETINDTGNPSVGVDAAIELGRFSGHMEVFSRLRLIEIEVDDEAVPNGELFLQNGLYGQLGFLVVPKRVQVGGRVGFISEDLNLNGNLNTQGAKTELSVGANLFILERRLMAQALFSQFFEVDDDPKSIFLLQLQGAL